MSSSEAAMTGRKGFRKDFRPVEFLLGAFLGAILVFSLFLVYGLLPNRWYRLLVITSGSMSPAIQPGDLILITPPPSVLKPGMILTLAVDGDLVTHRLVGFGEYGQLITRGDANPVEDDWDRDALQVAGIFRVRIPRLGYLVSLPGRISSGLFFSSGAWFGDMETIPGEIGASSGWVTPTESPDLCDLRGNLTVVPYHEKGEFGIDLRLCLENTGSAPIDILAVSNSIEIYPAWGEISETLSQLLDISAHSSLAPGEEYCYTARIPLRPRPGGKIRDRVEVYTILKPEQQRGLSAASQTNPVTKILDLAVEFTWPETLTEAGTPTPVVTLQPPSLTPPASFTPPASLTPPAYPTSPAAVTSALPSSTPLQTPTVPATPTGVPPAPPPPFPVSPSMTPAVDLPPATPATAQVDPGIPPVFSPTPVPPSPTPEFLPTPARPGVCVYPLAYWLEYPKSWPIDRLELGDQVYTRQEAVEILIQAPEADPGMDLARAFIVAILNAYQGADWRVAEGELLAAQTWFLDHPAGSPVPLEDARWVESLTLRLNEFNRGELGPQACPVRPTLTPQPSPTPSATITLMGQPADTATATPEPASSPTPAATTAAPTQTPLPTPTAPPTQETLMPTATPEPLPPTPTEIAHPPELPDAPSEVTPSPPPEPGG